MANLENVSADDLLQILAEVDDADASIGVRLSTGSPREGFSHSFAE